MRTLAPTRSKTLSHNHARILILSLLVAVGFVCVVNSKTIKAQGSAMRVETFRLNPGGQVQVENTRGAIRVLSWDDAAVRVVAEKKMPSGSPLDPSDLMLMRVQNTVVVKCRQGAATGRVDLTVYVPRDSAIQLTGGALPIEMSGSFAGAVVDTTSGSIAYRIPTNDDAQIRMRTERGIVKSTAPLAVTERTGTQSLEGRLGGGSAQVFLSSQSGSITLMPGPANASAIARNNANPQSPHNDATQIDNDPAYQARSNQPSPQTRNAGPSYRPSSLPGSSQQQQDRDSYEYTSSPPTQRGSAPSNQSSNGSVVFAGSDRSDDEDLTVSGIGPLSRPRQEKRTETGNSGMRVRIIPSTTPLGRENNGSSIYDRADYDQNTSGANQTSGGSSRNNSVDYGARPSAQANSQTSRSTNDRQYDPFDSSPRPSGGQAPDFDREPMATNRRPNAPPVLRNSGAGDSSESRTPAEPASKAGETDDETVVLKNALVNLNVLVTNRSGVALADLKKEDFAVMENGEPQSIEFFAPSTAPFNLVLVLDLSGSIKDKLDVVKSAALRFVDTVGPQDKIAVVTFTQDIRVVSLLTANRDELKRRIKAIERPEGGTAFYEAMWFALADTLRGTDGQRNAIVVMTDGVDSSLDRYNPAPTRVSFNRLTQRLEESDVVIFPIYLDTEYEEVFERGNASSESYAIARDQLARIAEVTGGQTFKAEKVGDLAGIYKQVAAAIRTVYSVGYYPQNPERDGTYRRLRVTVNRSEAAVRTRKGYYAK